MTSHRSTASSTATETSKISDKRKFNSESLNASTLYSCKYNPNLICYNLQIRSNFEHLHIHTQIITCLPSEFRLWAFGLKVVVARSVVGLIYLCRSRLVSKTGRHQHRSVERLRSQNATGKTIPHYGKKFKNKMLVKWQQLVLLFWEINSLCR